jgi:hypothetical protein
LVRDINISGDLGCGLRRCTHDFISSGDASLGSGIGTSDFSGTGLVTTIVGRGNGCIVSADACNTVTFAGVGIARSNKDGTGDSNGCAISAFAGGKLVGGGNENSSIDVGEFLLAD